MPISTPKWVKCRRCGKRFLVMRGDVIDLADLLWKRDSYCTDCQKAVWKEKLHK